MEITVGCDLEEFRDYYRTLELPYSREGELGDTEAEITRQDPTHLIILREGVEILGHAIWHEASTEEHRRGDPRDAQDKELLRKLLGGRRDLVELHELWIGKGHRGKGHGKTFFEFFEEFARSRGYDAIAYYADHPAAIAICRERGYEEGYLPAESWHVFARRLESAHSE